MNVDLETRQYLFDLQGYLVVEDVLDAGELAALNELIDGQDLPDKEGIQRFGDACGSSPEGPGFLQWGQPFCDLLDHERILPILRFRLGDCFRLDRIYGVFSQESRTSGGDHDRVHNQRVEAVLPRFARHQPYDLRTRKHAGLDRVDTNVTYHGVDLGLNDFQRYLLDRGDSKSVLRRDGGDRRHPVCPESGKCLQVGLYAGATPGVGTSYGQDLAGRASAHGHSSPSYAMFQNAVS